MDRVPPIRVLVVEAQAMLRAALRALLDAGPGIRVVADAGSRSEALAAVDQAQPDIILFHPRDTPDLWLDAISAFNAAAGKPGRVLIVADPRDASLPPHAVRLGAAGVVGMDRPAETLFKALHKVHAGEVWVERRLVAEMLAPDGAAGPSDRTRIATLTPREREVIRLVCEGLKNKQIAARLAVTDITVRHHLTSVFSKLGVPDRLALLLYASRHGLGPPLDGGHRHV